MKEKYQGEISSDSEESESFMIVCDDPDSSISSCSLEDFDESSSFSSHSSIHCSPPYWLRDYGDDEFGDDGVDESAVVDVDLMHAFQKFEEVVKNPHRHRSNGRDKNDDNLLLDLNNMYHHCQRKIRRRKSNKRLTVESTAAVVFNKNNSNNNNNDKRSRLTTRSPRTGSRNPNNNNDNSNHNKMAVRRRLAGTRAAEHRSAAAHHYTPRSSSAKETSLAASSHQLQKNPATERRYISMSEMLMQEIDGEDDDDDDDDFSYETLESKNQEQSCHNRHQQTLEDKSTANNVSRRNKRRISARSTASKRSARTGTKRSTRSMSKRSARTMSRRSARTRTKRGTTGSMSRRSARTRSRRSTRTRSKRGTMRSMSGRSTNTFGGRNWESCDSADSDCWSESLMDDAQKSQPQHELTDITLSCQWPNLQRRTLCSEEEQFGVSDHGTVHMMASEDDDSTPSSEDDSIVSYYYTDESSYVEIQSLSDSYDVPCSSEESSYFETSVSTHLQVSPSRCSKESSYVEISVSNHLSSHSRFATLTYSLPAASFEGTKQQAQCLEESQSEMTIKERFHSGDSKRQPQHSSNASAEVAAICNRVQCKLQELDVNMHELDVNMHKVIGEPMTLQLSDATYRSLRASLTGRHHSKPLKNNDRGNSHHTSRSRKRHSTPNLSRCKKLEEAFVNLALSPNKSARSYSPRSLNPRGRRMMHHRRESGANKLLPFIYL